MKDKTKKEFTQFGDAIAAFDKLKIRTISRDSSMLNIVAASDPGNTALPTEAYY